MSRIRANRPHRLVVEGKDKHAIVHLTARQGCDWDGGQEGLPWIEEAGSVERALEMVPLAVKTYERFGLVLDADNESPGKLEDFLARLIPTDDPCWFYAGEVTTAAKALGAPFRDVDHAKARIYTWLAWRKVPGLPFGTAIKAACFRDDAADGLSFVAWFRALFLE